MKSTVVDTKVVAVNSKNATATLVDLNEIDDVVEYNILMPIYFGGQTNPWPKVGESLRLRYDHSAFAHNPIENVWRPREEQRPAV
jgi:hypothetical protein